MQAPGAIGGNGVTRSAQAELEELRAAVLALADGATLPSLEAVANETASALRTLAGLLKKARSAAASRGDGNEARSALMRDLHAAVCAEALTVAYQPKLNLRTGRIDSVEALARWRGPSGEEVSPDIFIALAEETGDIAALTLSVLRMAVRDQAGITLEGQPLAVSVNLSAILLVDAAFCRQVIATCEAAPGPIAIEITETAVIADPEHALANLHAFANAGLRVSIDDYGSGLSSLAYLKSLPAQELKIDKAFVLGLSSSHRDPLIVRSTIDLAHALEMQVTAEGVDDPSALALLQVMGCDHAQGFHISRPLKLADLQAFLSASSTERLMPARNLFALRT